MTAERDALIDAQRQIADLTGRNNELSQLVREQTQIIRRLRALLDELTEERHLH